MSLEEICCECDCKDNSSESNGSIYESDSDEESDKPELESTDFDTIDESETDEKWGILTSTFGLYSNVEGKLIVNPIPIYWMKIIKNGTYLKSLVTDWIEFEKNLLEGFSNMVQYAYYHCDVTGKLIRNDELDDVAPLGQAVSFRRMLGDAIAIHTVFDKKGFESALEDEKDVLSTFNHMVLDDPDDLASAFGATIRSKKEPKEGSLDEELKKMEHGKVYESDENNRLKEVPLGHLPTARVTYCLSSDGTPVATISGDRKGPRHTPSDWDTSACRLTGQSKNPLPVFSVTAARATGLDVMWKLGIDFHGNTIFGPVSLDTKEEEGSKLPTIPIPPSFVELTEEEESRQIDEEDIDLVMKSAPSCERETAVRALKKTGNAVDAVMLLCHCNNPEL